METGRILLVEDNPDDVALVRRALRPYSARARLDVAVDGSDALNRLHAAATGAYGATRWPDLVLLDLRMSPMDGFDVLRHLRAEPGGRLVPVVVFTSSNEEGDIERAMDLGANSYVQKPVDFVDFARRVQAVVHYWLSVHLAAPSSAVSRRATPWSLA